MFSKFTRSLFTLAVLALLAVSVFAAPIYNYQYQYIPIGVPTGTYNSNCSPSGAYMVCVDTGTSNSSYLELWNNLGYDTSAGWMWSNSTVDNVAFSSLWKNVITSNDSGGASVYMSLNFWDTLSSGAGIYSDGQGGLNVWDDSQHRWRWELYNSTSQWACLIPGDPCASSGSWTNTQWGFSTGQNNWKNFVNGALVDAGSNPYNFNWGPNTDGGSWNSGPNVPEPFTWSTLGLGLGCIAVGKSGKTRRWLALLFRARR